MNKLVVIGYMGIKRCYLNTPMDEAIELFTQEEGAMDDNQTIREFEFDKSFPAYDVYPDDPDQQNETHITYREYRTGSNSL